MATAKPKAGSTKTFKANDHGVPEGMKTKVIEVTDGRVYFEGEDDGGPRTFSITTEDWADLE